LCIGELSVGCLKKESGCQYAQSNLIAPASEEQAVKDYLAANNISAIRHSSAMYYEIILTGNSGLTPNLCSQIVSNYSGRLMNGNIFDQQPNAVFVLGSLIEGWKKGLPLIQKGGHIKLYIPPSLAYGDVDVKENGTVIIPANSVLIFDITLIDVL
jgi:FKBP-type peptidyl-prolyl cis-trans isomerase FkpA